MTETTETYSKLVLNLFVVEGSGVPLKFDYTAYTGKPASFREALEYISREKFNDNFIPVVERLPGNSEQTTWVSANHIIKVTEYYSQLLHKVEGKSSEKKN